MNFNKVEIGAFLNERKDRLKPDEANSLGLKRIEKIDFQGKIHLVDNKPTKTNMILVKNGDLVISGINVEKGALSIYKGKEDVLATIHYSSYKYDSDLINIDYLRWFLKSEEFKKVLLEQVGGGIKTEIKPKKFLPLKINLANKDKQSSILKLLDEVNKYNEDVISINHINKEEASQLRKSILQEAAQGKLVAQDPNDEPASELLNRIKAEKEQLISDKKIKKEKPLPEITDDEIPFELPKGWVWCRLGDIINLISGQHILSDNYNKNQLGIPYLTGPSDFGKINPVYTKWTEKPKVTADQNSILITVKGSGIGKLNILNDDKIAISRQLMALHATQINHRFLYLYLLIKNEYLQDKKTGIAIPGITREDICSLLFPLPSLNEQKRIVAKVDELMNLCDQLEIQIKESKENADMLMQSVLQEAFAA